MVFVTFISIVAVLCSYLAGIGKMKNGLQVAFILIATLSCLRYNYGNDYLEYMESFESDITSFSSIIHRNYSERTEPGWMLLSLIFRPFGFFTFVCFLSIYENIVIYKFIKTNVNRRYQWIALSVYLFNFCLYLLGLSMMRQFLAMVLILQAYSFMREKRLVPALCWVLLATTIHMTAIIFLPFVVVPWLPLQKGKWIALVLAGILAVLFASETLVTRLFVSAISDERVEWYVRYAKDADGSIFGKKYILTILVFAFSCFIIASNEVPNNKKYAVVLFSISTVLSPFYNIAMFSRLGYYFLIFSMVAVPDTFVLIRKRPLKYLFLFAYFTLIIFEYFQYLSDDVWAKSYATYHTIIEVL